MTAVRGCVSVLAALVVSVHLSGQVTARQGEPPPEQYFESPMVLEIPFSTPSHDAIKSGEQAYFSGPDSRRTLPRNRGLEFESVRDKLNQFICENTSIEKIDTLWRTVSRDEVTARLTFVLKNRPGHDKLVQMELMLLDKEDKGVCPPFRLKNVDAEEGRLTSASVWTNFPTSRLEEKGLKLLVRFSAVSH